MRATQSGPVLIFLHLPKTGGRTLSRIIEHQYGSNTILDLYQSSFGEELATLPQRQLNHLRAIRGHFYFGAHTFLSRPSTYITILRDPIDRVISHYYFVQRDPTHYLYRSSQEMSLRDYVITCNLAEPNNDQTRLLAGKDHASRSGACSPEMLAAAKRNLRDHFAVVGLTEEFDRSLILIRRVLGWRHPFYMRQNVSSFRPRKEDIPDETLRVIQAYNELDCELYRYGKELFQEQIRQQAAAFERELRIFKKVNAIYAKLHLLLAPSVGKLRARCM